jgi:uncharacterized RDD family membrane protein YckC
MSPDKRSPEDESGGPDDGARDLFRLLNTEGTLAGPPQGQAPVEPPPPPKAGPKDEPKAPSKQTDPWEVESEWRETRPAGGDDDNFEHASKLRQILDSPESAGESIELATRPGAGLNADYDSAVQAYMRNLETRIPCRKHPERESVSQCPECQTYYCQECMTIRRGRMLCRDCAETSFVMSEEEIIEAQAQGLDAPEHDVAAEAAPEFQVGGEWMGMEGAPASPLKLLFALLIDYVLARGVIFVLLLVFNAMGLIKPAIFAGFFDPDIESVWQRVSSTLILMRPLVPWLPLAAAVDFLYYFLCLSFTNRTLGMSWLGCRIVTIWGEFVPFGGVAMRTLVFMAFFELPAVLASSFFPRYRGPHDLLAGTLVINYSGVKRVDSYDTIQLK